MEGRKEEGRKKTGRPPAWGARRNSWAVRAPPRSQIDGGLRETRSGTPSPVRAFPGPSLFAAGTEPGQQTGSGDGGFWAPQRPCSRRHPRGPLRRPSPYPARGPPRFCARGARRRPHRERGPRAAGPRASPDPKPLRLERGSRPRGLCRRRSELGVGSHPPSARGAWEGASPSSASSFLNGDRLLGSPPGPPGGTAAWAGGRRRGERGQMGRLTASGRQPWGSQRRAERLTLSSRGPDAPG